MKQLETQTLINIIITQLREARKHDQLASAYQEEVQQTVAYTTYLVTAGGQIHTEEAPHPHVVQLLQHAQDLQFRAKQEVLISNNY